MNPVYVAALEVQRLCRKKRWRFCIIGGIAIARWGEPRATKDADFTLLTELKTEEKIIAEILQQFQPRVPDAGTFASTSRVLLCSASNGVSLDIALAVSGYEREIVDRASPFQFMPKCSLITASAEDIVVLKAIADRELDWRDVSGIIARQGERLDWDYLVPRLSALCELKEDSSPLERLDRLRQET